MFQEASTQTLAIAGLSVGAERCADGVLAHRYRLLDRRGDDGISIGTVLADDLLEGGRVVLKIVPAVELASDFALQVSSEAENRRRVHSHRLAPLVDFGCDGEICYFAARMPPGISLENLLAAPRLDVAVTLQVAIGVFSALRDLHEHGLLLGCLDPSLVFVNADPSARAVTVLHMALPWSWKASAAVSAEAQTAAAYISPEQSGFIESRTAFTSDLYSTGILLYRCLAGATPFRGNSVGEVLLGHVTTSPRELRSLGLPVPRVLDELILRLLRKDPRDRYQTAEAVLADLREIAAGLSRGEAEPQLVIGQSDRRATLTEPSFVSRAREINELTGEFFAAALDGRGAIPGRRGIRGRQDEIAGGVRPTGGR